MRDALGRTVARLANEPMAAGEHEFNLDATPRAPGVYHIRLVAGAAVRTRRLAVGR